MDILAAVGADEAVSPRPGDHLLAAAEFEGVLLWTGAVADD